MRKVFTGLAFLLPPVIVVQFYLAASAAFDTAPKDESFQLHRALGYGIVLLAIVSAIVAALARAPGPVVGLAALIAGLGLLQAVIRVVAAAFDDTGDTATTAGRLVFGLHAVNGLIMFGLAETVARRARALSRPGPAGAAVGPAPAS
jgi:heme A synthase